MTTHADTERPVIVLDVLSTLVDQAGSLRREVSAATDRDESATNTVVTAWLHHVASRERESDAGDTAFTPNHTPASRDPVINADGSGWGALSPP